MSKVFIGVGHGGKDSGAVGYLIEKDVNLKMAKACRDYLVARDVEVLMSREKDENDSVSEEIKECNTFAPNLAVECHNNSGNGNGFEVYYSIGSKTGKKLAENIEAEVIKIGQNSRGIKTRANSSGGDYYGFVRETKCPAVICEGVFVDNAEDAKQADTDEECKKFGEAYAKGVLKTLGIADVPPTSENTTPEVKEEPYLVKVTTDALNIREKPGTVYKVVGLIRDRGVYTIVETVKSGGNTWGRLKSGAGWIALEYTKRL